MSVTMLINVNTADKEELKQIPGVGERVARLLIQFREVYGVIKKEALNLALRGKLLAEALEMIDFSVPRQEDPFDIDLSCLPAVPKTNSWEPLVSFAHQTAARQSRYQVGESFATSASHYAEQGTSPKLAGASSMHESQESRPCRTDSRPVSQCDEEDAKPSVSKTSSSKSANHSSGKSDAEVEKKNRTASGSRSQRHSRSSQGGMGSCRSKSPKAYRSSSRSRSPSSRRHSRKHSPKKTRRRHGKGSSSVSRSRSHSSSVSRSRSVERRSRKSEKKGMKKKKHDSSISASRSRSAEHRSRKSDTKVKNKKKQDSSRSDSSSRSVRHSSRKGDSKTRKIKSQRKNDKHSRSRSRSASRSSSKSASRSSSRSLSRSHKRRTKTKGDKSRVNKHKNRLSSRSRSSSRSNSRSSHKKRVKTRRAKSKVHKHKRQSSSCSESQPRSRSRSRSQRTKTRSKKTKRRSHRHSPHADSDTDTPRHGNPRKHPKALHFDGKTNWLSFKKKFDSYRKVMRWSEEESKDYLMWSLERKALDFLTITKIDLEKYSFRKIMKKLETRFGVKELTETSKAKFRQAFQKQDESLEDWADRVMTLATPPFLDLPEDHLKREAIARFCQGCTDKEAAKHACFEQPETMEEALNLVKHHQYISQAVDGKKAKREYEASVKAVQSPSEARVEQLIRSALKDFAAKLQESSTSLSSSSETEEKAKKKKSSSQCFFCKKFGHFKKDCRVYQAWLSKKQESKSEDSEGHSGQKQ